MASGGMWTASSSVGNATCSWPQEALNSSTGSFKPISKWRILRSVFHCTRMWRYVGRQAQNLRVRYTLGLQYRSIEVNQDLATPNPSNMVPTLPMTMSSGKRGSSLGESKQSDKARHGCNLTSCNSQDLIHFGQIFKPCMVVFPQSNHTPQATLAVVAFVVVLSLSLECDQYPTDHVDWGRLGTSYVFGTPLESKNLCVSIVKWFQAASILLFQAAYLWLKFRKASSSGRKRKMSDLQGVLCDGGLHQSSRGVYARAIKDKGGNVVGHKYEPRFKPPRERNAQGKVLSFQNLSLGSYNDPRDAEIIRQIAAFYYDKDNDLVSLGDGRSFRIPAISQHGLSGTTKANWVSENAKKVFELYCNPHTTEGRSQSGNQSSSPLHTSFHDTSSLNHEFPHTAASPVTLTDQIADGIPDPTSTETYSVNVVPSSSISHSGDGAKNSARPLSDTSPPGDNRVCTPNLRSNEQLGTEVDLQAADEKHTISGVVIQHTGVSSELDNMVVDKEGETLQAVDHSTNTSLNLNFNQTLTQLTGWKDAAEELNTIRDIGEFLLGDPEDVVPGTRVELHQSEGIVGLGYCQLQPHFLTQAPHCSTPCNTTTHGQSLSQFDPARQSGLPCGIQFQSSEGSAATSCKWGMDALTSEGAAVHNSHCSEVPTSSMLSQQQESTGMAPTLTEVTPSLHTNFCSENCLTDLLLGVVSSQQKQIEELKHVNEILKGTSGLKCPFCCSPLY